MTVSAITPSVSFSYTGPGDYAYTFLCYDEGDLVVLFTDDDGADTTLALGTDYTVALESDFLGGTLTLINPADTSGSLRVDRVLPFTQEVDWVNNDPLDAGLLERSFDRTVMLLQQMNQEVLAGTSAFTWEGTWATGTAYQVRAMVEGPDGNWYYCNYAHTSGVFATDLAAGIWTLLINRASLLAAVADAETAEENAEAAQAAAEARTIDDPATYRRPFWGDLDSRPFMRALHGQGLCLWRLGETAKARGIFAWMLALNPNDNQGVRFLLHDLDEGLSWEESVAREEQE